MYKVLLVEDETMLRKGMKVMVDFEKCNCIVCGEAENGEEGIQKIQKLHPEIVITDVKMPIKDGMQMLETTKEEGYSAIIVSGFNDFTYAKQAMKFGACEYLLKPVDPNEMEEALKRAVEQQKMRKAYEKALNQKQELETLALIQAIQEDKDDLAVAMLHYIEDKYQEKIVMEDLCKALNYSETLLNRKFKEAYQCTFNDYLNRYRIQKAMELMRKKESTLEEIAIQCGFTNYKYFSTVFRKYISCSPKEYQKSM